MAMGLVAGQVSVVNDQPVWGLAGREWDQVSGRAARSLAAPVAIDARVRQPEGLKSES